MRRPRGADEDPPRLAAAEPPRDGEPRRLGRDYLSALARHLASAAAGVVTLALCARALGPEGVALWSLLGTSAFLLGLADLGLGVAAQRAAARGRDADAGARLGLGLLGVLVLGLPATVGIGLQLARLPDGAGAPARDLGVALTLGLAAGLVGAAAGPYRQLAVVLAELRALAQARALGAALQLAITVALLPGWRSLGAPAAGLLAGNALELWLVVRVLRRARPGLRPCLPRGGPAVRTALSDGLGALSINAAVALAARADVALVAAVAPLRVVAAYSVASRAVDQVYTLAKQASAAALPQLADPHRRSRAIEEGTSLLGSLAAAGLFGLLLCGDPLLRAWATAEVWQGPAPTLLLGLGLAALLAGLAEVPAAALTLAGRTSWAGATPVVLANLTRILVGLATARALGATGPVLGALAGSAVGCALAWRGLRPIAPGLTLRHCLRRPLRAAGVTSAVALALGGVGDGALLACALALSAASGAGLAAALRDPRPTRSSLVRPSVRALPREEPAGARP